MHLHNALHTPVQLLDGLRRAVGESDGSDFDGTSRFSETLQPVLDIWSQPEWAILRGELLYSRFGTSPAVAARFASFELVNPAGSGVLAIVRGFNQLSATVVDVSIDVGVAIGANPVVLRGVCRDNRNPRAGETSRCTLTRGDLAAGAINIQAHIANQQQLPDRMMSFILPPGGKLFLVSSAVNLGFDLNVSWSERLMLPGEERA